MTVGVRAVVGVLVVAVLGGLGLGLLLRDGDDGGASSGGDASSAAADEGGDDGADDSDDDGAADSDGTGEFEVEVPDDDGAAATLPIRVEAGDAVRIVVEGLDSALYLIAEDDARTEGFESLQPRDQSDLGVQDVEGLLFLATDRSSDDVEGLQFVAPSSGTFTLAVTGGGGDAEVRIEREPGDADLVDEVLGGDEVDYGDYVALYADHVDFFCDEAFFGGDPFDVTNYGPTVCDEEVLAGVEDGRFSGDFTNDFEAGL